VSDKLRKQIAVEQDLINRLLEEHRSLVRKCATEVPDAIERSALAAMLHSFYTGIENVFRRIAIEYDGYSPDGDTWHRDLLDVMAQPTGSRPAVISQDLHDMLRDYLGFRHMFRHLYSINLKWDRMADLVLGVEAVWQQADAEFQALLNTLSQGPGGADAP
jgi:hypothetical protein